MTLVCAHCSRVNTADARFCYFDGASLLGGAVPIEAARKTFLAPFVFPTGVTCTNYDEFAGGCQTHWDTAVEMLRRGALETFFNGLGRLDLALAAQEAASFPDRDRGLDIFLARLPTTCVSLPRLDVQPKLIDLGTLSVGQNAQFELTLENRGSRLVFGSVATTVPWLAVSESNDALVFQFRERASVRIQVRGDHLRAGLKPLDGTIVIESNAGAFKLKVLASVPIQAFPEGVLAGARSPRELAEKAKAAPRQAAGLFESGAVERWYQSNGWTYPVQGPSFSGLAAVQQFFEALGISRAPRVYVTTACIDLQGEPGARVAHKLEARTSEGRAVYAHAVSPVPWIIVKAPLMLGTVAALPLEVQLPASAGETLRTTLRVFANGKQRFDVPVEVTAVGSSQPPAASGQEANAGGLDKAVPSTVAEQSVAPESVEQRTRASILFHVVPVFLLAALLAGLIGWDVMRDQNDGQQAQIIEEPPEAPPKVEPEFKVAIQDEPDDNLPVVRLVRFKIEDEPEERIGDLAPPPVKVEIKDEPAENPGGADVPIAAAPLVAYDYAGTPSTFGIRATASAGGAARKNLTYSRNGSTNSTMVSIAGARLQLGAASGQWTRSKQPLENIAATPGAIQPTHSTWVWNGVAFHQVLEVIPGQPVNTDGGSRRHLDTVLVRWVLENTGKVARSAGLRMQLDTLIGSNDGVPFTVPGYPNLVDSLADFRVAKNVPDFIQALERPSLRDPGTVAHLTLKPGRGIEPPGRVSLTLWPDRGFTTNRFTYDVPVTHMLNDSAVVMYWPEKSLKPGEARTIGFAYGLGNVAASDKLGVTLGGSFEPGQHFTATAYIENPIAGQTVKIDVPDGLRRIDGAETQSVPAGKGKTVVVTWKVLVERTGDFRVKVQSSTGLSQTKNISIARGSMPTGGKFSVDLHGSFEPGQSFTVVAKVIEPIDGQRLTLTLPEGLQREGDATLRVPAAANGSKEAQVAWKVKVLEPGKYPVRVSSSTGVAQTKTITIVRPGRAEGAFQIVLAGEFAPGKTFNVSTKVANPAPDQKLTLVLPDGLDQVDGAAMRSVEAGEPIAWQVKVREPGRYLIGVKSTTGVTQRKTVAIEPPAEQGGRFDFEFSGDIRPGKEFTVKATVQNPVAKQSLTLVLPKGMHAVDAGARAVPDDGVVAWQVRVLEPGRLTVRVESSTGLVRSKTITLSESTSTLFGR